MAKTCYSLILLIVLGFVSSEILPSSQADAAVTRKKFDFVLGVDGDFKAAMTVAGKAASSGSRFFLFFPKGEYNIGKLTGDSNGVTTFSTSNVSFIGENADSTIIFNQSVQEGISITSTLYFYKADNLYLQDLTILNKANYRNSADLSKTGRHVAVKEQGNKIIYKNVKLLSTQDTYYTCGTRTYWEDGEIHGTVDFICGQGDVFFNRCLLYLERDKSCIAAPATKSSWGYVFINCTIDGTGSNHLLGRSWDNQPKCVYINTTMKKLPTSAAWGEPMNVVPSLFAEYNSKTASGSSVDISGRRSNYTKNGTTVNLKPVLTSEQAAKYTVENVLKGSDNWQPDKLTQQVNAPVAFIEGKLLKWDDNDRVLCWVVFKDKKFYKCVTVNSCEISADKADAKYTVRAANEMGGLSPFSNTVSGAVTTVSAGSELSSKKSVLIYNSEKKLLFINNLSVGKMNIEILSLNGKSVLSKNCIAGSGECKVKTSLDGLKSGIYLVRIESEGSAKIQCINIFSR
ncbi:MAG TPA: pectinesterase family protein [Chitinispirillaceae bacterium]|nr:pectinesterase family protein [Chitinispirillaceae bacterium]